jgi:hypothetical protein
VQGAADLAALSGALSLPSTAAAQAAAQAVATSNGYTNAVDGTIVIVNPSYATDKILVQITRSVPTFFMRIAQINSVDVQGRAVAERLSSSYYTIYANQNTCDPSVPGIDWSGSGNTVTGGVHTNGTLKMGGSGNTVNPAPATYDCGIDTYKLGGDGVQQSSTYVDWPTTYTTATDSSARRCGLSAWGRMIRVAQLAFGLGKSAGT